MSSDDLSWISWFCGHKGHEFFCEVDEEYVMDRFNLTGLSEIVPYYKESMKLILNEETEETDDDEPSEMEITESASMLYGLIHARYILTSDGMKKMIEKWNYGEFGKCPNVFCNGQHCLPIGMNSEVHKNTVKLFCPSCVNIYNHRSSNNKLDGAYFGPNFPQMLFMMYPELKPKLRSTTYVPRLFGFKISPLAYQNN